MRWLAIVFVVLIAALQYPMWLGKGGWLQVRETGRAVAAQQAANARLKTRNDALDADVRDLKTGFEAVEERARAELGMVRQDEVFFQVQSNPVRTGAGGAAAPRDAPAAALRNESVPAAAPAPAR